MGANRIGMEPTGAAVNIGPDMTDEELRLLFMLSADIGAPLQKSGVTPAQACLVLLIVAGRIFAREAFASMNRESAWKTFTHRDMKAFFQWGFDEERLAGHMGYPRVPS